LNINEEPPAPPPTENVDTNSVAVSIDTQPDDEVLETPEDGIQVGEACSLGNLADFEVFHPNVF
jgi:hypothetical protein